MKNTLSSKPLLPKYRLRRATIASLAICCRMPFFLGLFLVCAVTSSVSSAAPSHAHDAAHIHPASQQHGDQQTSAPEAEFRDPVLRVLLLQDYNTRVVLLGTMLLGISAGVVGTFMLLRKRALIGDVIGHAALPGIAIAFIASVMISPETGKSFPILLFGATISGFAGVLCTTGLRKLRRVKEDASLAIVLSVFYGLGIALTSIIQRFSAGSSAGIESFLFGQAAAINAADVFWISVVSLMVLTAIGLLFKEFSLLCFDSRFASSEGWPTGLLDVLLMCLVVFVSVVGMQSVGLILVVALLITPAAAARFWSNNLAKMTVISGFLGGLSALSGAAVSAVYPQTAAGPTIVLAGTCFFLLSLVFGIRSGLLPRYLIRLRLKQNMGEQHLMRAFYELLEQHLDTNVHSAKSDLTHDELSFDMLLSQRSWSAQRLRRLLHRAIDKELIQPTSRETYRFTKSGEVLARQITRNHRMWELYLISFADIAPTHVDRDADWIEHILDPELIARLEELFAEKYPHMDVPPSPHKIELST